MAKISKRNYTTRKRNIYSFEASWELADRTVNWEAKIWRGGQVVGAQGGTFWDTPGSDIDKLVAGRVRANLEAGMENAGIRPPRVDA